MPLRLLKVIAAVLAFGGLAILSFSQSLGMVAARFSPQLALQLYPKNGLAIADVALIQVVTAVMPTPGQDPKAPDPQSLQLALRARTIEPLAYDAVSAAAFYYAAEGERERARGLMHQALALTRRDKAANVWLVEDYARQGDIGGTLRHVDLAQRTSRSVGAVLNPVLAGALAQSDSVEPFERLLADRPFWAEDFWLAALKHDAALVNAARLRSALARRGDRTASDIDAALVEKLVRAGLFELAFELHESIVGAGPGSPSPPATGEFAAEPILPPIDWALHSGGDLGADILPNDEAMLVSAVPGSSGVAARRLLRLGPGRHELALALRRAPLDRTRMELALHCAKRGENGARVFVERILAQRTVRSFTTSDQCSHYWLELVVSVPEDGEADDLIVAGLELDGEGPD